MAEHNVQVECFPDSPVLWAQNNSHLHAEKVVDIFDAADSNLFFRQLRKPPNVSSTDCRRDTQVLCMDVDNSGYTALRTDDFGLKNHFTSVRSLQRGGYPNNLQAVE